MGRDLLYKPPVPILQSEETENKPKPKTGAAAGAGIQGTRRSRELGSVGAQAPQLPAGSDPTAHAGKKPAYKAAYFNQDTSGVRAVNLRQSNAAALRGGDGATDLRKIVLPPSASGVETPDPVQLRGASDLMGLDGSFALNLENMLGRQSAWARGKGVTVEMLEARLAQLERMVEDRKKALARLAGGSAKRRAASVSVTTAAEANGKALDGCDDVAKAGTELIGRTVEQANGMHHRIAKMLGIKRPQ